MPDGHHPSARGRLLAAAEEMLRESGMHGAGIKEVVRRSGAPIGSLYHYFPGGKAQLVGESLQMHADKLPRLVDRFFDGKRSPSASLRAWFNAAADGFEKGGADKGCAIGAVALDLMPADAEIRSLCKKVFDDWVGIIAPQLPFPDQRSRRSFAVTIVAALEGAFVLSRAAESGQPFRDAGKWLSAMLAAHGPERGRRPRLHKLIPRSRP